MEPDDMAAKQAELQHGVFTISQVRQHGGTDAAVLHRLQTGAWKLLPYRGVYLVAGCPCSWEQQLHALVLAAGPSAAASHRSAAALLGIPGFSRQGRIEVVTTRALRNRTPGAYVHSSRQLPPDHLTVVEASSPRPWRGRWSISPVCCTRSGLSEYSTTAWPEGS